MSGGTYYNEIDPYAAQWLRNLISAGHIAPGDVDERSIADVRADDVRGYVQCHWFAGIGGWSVALRLAGWPDDRPVWTGSCPCQPFSSAGAGKAADDSRHLWPAWFPLIAERRPPTVFGEQVEAAIGWGWLDAVFADLESQGYACGAAVLPACGVGAPHIRQRLWFVANASWTDRRRHGGESRGEAIACGGETRTQDGNPVGSTVPVGIVGFSNGGRREPRGTPAAAARHGHSVEPAGGDGRELGNTERPRLQEQRGLGSFPPSEGGTDAREASERASASVGAELLGDAAGEGLDRPARSGSEGPSRSSWPSEPSGVVDAARVGCEWDGSSRQWRNGFANNGADFGGSSDAIVGAIIGGPGCTSRIARDTTDFWSPCDWLPCTDGKARPVEPGSFPLASGVLKRASKLRAYGNAIVPEAAAAFIESYMNSRP